MSSTVDPARIPQALVDAVRGAERIVALCGAGLSAESGIPTFREARTGLWAKHDPMTLASPEGFDRQPALVWRWYQWRRSLVADAEPNAGHRALAELQQQRPSTRLITQNVDGLQQRAGSQQVIELHGNLHRNLCSRTRKPIDRSWLDQHADLEPPPSPHHPEGRTRPDVVWFGEALDAQTLQQALDACRTCDLMFVIGTSGLVHPAASLPLLARENDARLIEINPQRSALTAVVDWHWPQSSAAVLPTIVASL
jgi:NAD-dependent deacetylase